MRLQVLASITHHTSLVVETYEKRSSFEVHLDRITTQNQYQICHAICQFRMFQLALRLVLFTLCVTLQNQRQSMNKITFAAGAAFILY